MEPPISIVLPVAVGLVAVVGIAYAFLRRARQVTDQTVAVVAVGGGGIEAADAMHRAGVPMASYVAVDTDGVALGTSRARTKIPIGQTHGGMGSGGNVASAEAAAREAKDEIAQATAGAEVVLIVAALGGGTGSGAAPIVAEVARGQGALTVAVATEPFGFEGARRRTVAAQAGSMLASKVDALATVASDGVRETMPPEITAEDAFKTIDQVMHRNVAEILDLLAVRGRINLDLAHLKAMLQGGAPAAVGFGRASGSDRAVEAAAKALASTLLGKRLKAATSLLVNVTGSRNLKLAELDTVIETLLASVASGAEVTVGMGVKPALRNEVQVTLLVTGYDSPRAAVAREDGEPSAEAVPWRPVWLRRANDNQAVKPAYVAGATAANAEKKEEVTAEDRPSGAPAPETEAAAATATAEAPRSKRQKRAAARAARRAETPPSESDQERSAPIRFPQSS